VRNATQNETTNDKLNQWCERILAEQNKARLPGEVALGLADLFNLQEVALRVWGLDLPEEGVGAPVSQDVHIFAEGLTQPYCGTNTEFVAATWLSAKPASVAILALRTPGESAAFGLLVLGSDDPQRFSPEMGTQFLDVVSRLAGAALSRLKPQAT